MSGIVNDAIRAATLVVIPARPSVFDLDAVKETIAYARERRKPYAVVLNGAPAKRDGAESPLCTQARDSLETLRAPVWFGQITHRTTYSLALAGGQGAREFDAESQAASEIARLFNSIERSVKAIQGRIQGRERHAPQGGVTAAYRRSGHEKSGAAKLRRRRLRTMTSADGLQSSPYFSSAATFSMPALAQASSLSPPGAPDTPMAPIVSSPTLIGSAP